MDTNTLVIKLNGVIDRQGKEIEKMNKLLIEIESVDAHAKTHNFDEDLQMRISDTILNNI